MIVIDARYIQDHFPGIGRYTYHLIDSLARIGPEEKFAALYNPVLRNTRYDLAALARHPNLELARVDVPTFSLREQFQLPGSRFYVSRPTRDLRQDSKFHNPASIPGHSSLKPRQSRGGWRPEAWNLKPGTWNLKPSLLHSPYFIKPYFTAVPSVVTLFDLIPLRYPGDLPSWHAQVMFRLTTWLAARTAARIIAPSRATRDDLVRLLQVPLDKIRVVPLAADSRFAPQPEGEIARVRDKYGLRSPFVLYVGINKPHKNLATLVRAVRQLEPGRAMLVVAGAWDARYEHSSETAGLEVKWIHEVAEIDLPALYSGAAAFVMPSLYEGFGLPALEAMACGTPVLAANAGSLPEVVENAGLLFEPLNANALAALLARVLGDRECQDEMMAKSLARAADFSWERTARQTLAVYREVI